MAFERRHDVQKPKGLLALRDDLVYLLSNPPCGSCRGRGVTESYGSYGAAVIDLLRSPVACGPNADVIT